MISRDRSFGQAGEAAALAPTSSSPFTFYLLAVAAGMTVFFLSRWLSRR